MAAPCYAYAGTERRVPRASGTGALVGPRRQALVVGRGGVAGGEGGESWLRCAAPGVDWLVACVGWDGGSGARVQGAPGKRTRTHNTPAGAGERIGWLPCRRCKSRAILREHGTVVAAATSTLQ